MRAKFIVAIGLCSLWTAVGCVSAVTLKPAVRTTIAGNGEILTALIQLDQICQSKATSPADLLACREPRDRIRNAVKATHDAWAPILGDAK